MNGKKIKGYCGHNTIQSTQPCFWLLWPQSPMQNWWVTVGLCSRKAWGTGDPTVPCSGAWAFTQQKVVLLWSALMTPFQLTSPISKLDQSSIIISTSTNTSRKQTSWRIMSWPELLRIVELGRRWDFSDFRLELRDSGSLAVSSRDLFLQPQTSQVWSESRELLSSAKKWFLLLHQTSLVSWYPHFC